MSVAKGAPSACIAALETIFRTARLTVAREAPYQPGGPLNGTGADISFGSIR